MQNYTILVHNNVWQLLRDQKVIIASETREGLISEITLMLSAVVHGDPVTSNTVNEHNAQAGLDLVFGRN